MAIINFKDFSIKNDLPSIVMGIVNASPESFYKENELPINKAFSFIELGADVLDIGGMSTRPGFNQISEEEEISRVIPLIKQIRKESSIILSIDTCSPKVAKLAIEEGVNIVNSICNLQDNQDFLQVFLQYHVPIVIMHGFGINLKEENLFGKDKIVKEVKKYFNHTIKYLVKSGLSKKNIILDCGIGFGKSNEENLSLIRNCNQLCIKDFPLLMALSRKRCIGSITNTSVQERLNSTICADLFTCVKGAKILRVHDVKETIESLKVMKTLY